MTFTPPPPRDPGRIAGPIVVPNAIVVQLSWTLASGKPVINVLHGSVGAGFTATAAIAQAIFAGITTGATFTTFAALLHTTASLTGVSLKDIRTANQPLVSSTGTAVAGTGAGVALPPGVCMTITERTASAGRGFRGRIYIPGWDSTAFTAATGAFTTAAQTAAVNWIGLLASTMTAQGISQALAQPARQQYFGRKGRLILARTAAVVLVTSNTSRLTAATSQRRRSLVA